MTTGLVYFILKSIGYPIILLFLQGLLAGFVMSIGRSDHPHQILPTWLLYALLFAMVGIGVSIVTTIVFAFMSEPNLRLSVLISCGVTIAGVVVYMVMAR